MSKEIDEKASLLGRMLTHFQLSAGSKMPLPLVIVHVRLVHQVSGELLELLQRAPAGTTVEMDTKLGEAGAALLAEFYQGQETPDTFPPDWDHD